MRLSLQAKILLLVSGTAALLAAVILLSQAYISNRQVDRTIATDVRTAVGVLTLLLNERTNALAEQAPLLAKQPIVIAEITTNDHKSYTDSAGEYRSLLNADAVVIMNRDGSVFGASGLPGADHSDPIVQIGAQTAKADAAWRGVAVRQSHLMICVSVPILIAGQVWGSFTACQDIDSASAKDLKLALGANVAFVYHNRVVGASLPLPIRIPTPHAGALVTYGNVRYVALYAPLPGSDRNAGMGFVTLERYDKITAAYAKSRLVFFAVSLFTLLIAITAGVALAHNLTRPLDGVVRAAQTLREGDWPLPFDVKRSDEIGLLQSVFNDMTEAMRTSQDRLLALVHVDSLTDLHNHRSFQERLTQEAHRAGSSDEPLSLLLIDIDQFADYNLKNGHASGDDALKLVALVLTETAPEISILARYAGEKFTALLPQTSLDEAADLAELLRSKIASLYELGLIAQPITVSIGCSEFGTNTSEPEGLVLAAELAMSRAKQLGRNMVCRFDSVPGADTTADPYQLHKFLKDESLATIQALAAAVDAKDPYTRGHSQSVAYYASELGREIGMSNSEVELIHTAGTLHDVGKIGVPDAILKKAAKLSQDEQKVMETHPVLGEVIVRKAPALANILPSIRHHHERWDGCGYPDRLEGAAIPIMARLLSVADTFDAMTSDRPYRKGLPMEVALAEIEKMSGTQFDPELASAFMIMMRDHGEVKKHAA